MISHGFDMKLTSISFSVVTIDIIVLSELN